MNDKRTAFFAGNRLRVFLISVLSCVLMAATVAFGMQLKSRPAKDWIKRLERPERVGNLKEEEVIARLGLKPGSVVADIGAGSGIFSRPLARAVTPTGKLLAVEIDQGFLDYIDRRSKEEKITNIETVLGGFDDPKLTTHEVDLAFFHDVLHHIKHRRLYLKNLAAYIKPNGRVAIIDLIDGPHRDDPKLQITLDQVKNWMGAAGFHLIREYPLFENKFFVLFGRNR